MCYINFPEVILICFNARIDSIAYQLHIWDVSPKWLEQNQVSG